MLCAAVCLLLLHSALDVVARRAALMCAVPCCSRRWAASVPALRSRTGRSGGMAVRHASALDAKRAQACEAAAQGPANAAAAGAVARGANSIAAVRSRASAPGAEYAERRGPRCYVRGAAGVCPGPDYLPVGGGGRRRLLAAPLERSSLERAPAARAEAKAARTEAKAARAEAGRVLAAARAVAKALRRHAQQSAQRGASGGLAMTDDGRVLATPGD